MKKLYMVLVMSDDELADRWGGVEINFKFKSVYTPIQSAHTRGEAIKIVEKMFKEK